MCNLHTPYVARTRTHTLTDRQTYTQTYTRTQTDGDGSMSVSVLCCRDAAAALRSLAGEGGTNEDAAKIRFVCQWPIRRGPDPSPLGGAARPLRCSK